MQELRISEKNEKEFAENAQRVVKSVEAGDLALYDIIEQAFAIFGFTKVGKTTSCHQLSGNSLQAFQKSGEFIWKQTGQNTEQFKIGLEKESETEIPNIFNAVLALGDKPQDNKHIKLLDMPGYGDSYGFSRIYSNGYFHYRMFSKVRKLKFIVAFDRSEMNNTGERVRKTIFTFLQTFKNYQQYKQEILSATVFLVTKVQKPPPAKMGEDIKSVKQRFMNLISGDLKNMTEGQIMIFKQMVTHMVENDKVFVMNRPDKIGARSERSPLLTFMHKKTEFWTRQQVENIIDMSQVQFSVAKTILTRLSSYDDPLFKPELSRFMTHMQKRTRTFLIDNPNSFKNILSCLIQDVQAMPNQAQTLGKIKQFVKDHYAFNDNRIFKEKRAELQKNMFKCGQQVSFDSSNAEPYFVRKFKVLQNICSQIKKIADTYVVRTTQTLEVVSVSFREMFKQLQKLRICSEDGVQIIRYTYLLQRIIEQAKIMTQIVFLDPELERELCQRDPTVKATDIYRILQDELLAIFQTNVGALKKEYIRKRQVEDFDNLTVAAIRFLEPKKSVDIQTTITPGKRSEQQILKDKDRQYREKKDSEKKQRENETRFSHIVLKFEQTLEKQPNVQERKYETVFFADNLRNCRQKLLKIHTLLSNLICDAEEEQQQYEERKKQSNDVIDLTITVTSKLAKTFRKLDQFEIARALYNSIHDVPKVLQIYEEEINKKNSQPSNCLILYQKMGNYAKEKYRHQKAMQCYQKGYSMSSHFSQRSHMNMLILQLIEQLRYNKFNEDYPKVLEVSQFIQPLPQEIQCAIDEYLSESEKLNPMNSSRMLLESKFSEKS